MRPGLIGRRRDHQGRSILPAPDQDNPVLIGEPGVGKTASSRSAQRIVNEEVAGNAEDKRVLSLDMAALLAGPNYRGEFEERLKSVPRSWRRTRAAPHRLHHELHPWLVRQAEGAIDAGTCSNRLWRGELTLRPARHAGEYRKYIEKDAALERASRRCWSRASVEKHHRHPARLQENTSCITAEITIRHWCRG